MLAVVALMNQEDEDERKARYQFNLKRLLRDANNVFEMGHGASENTIACIQKQ